MTDWTILVATIGQRRRLLARLLNVLLPQVDQQGGRVKVLAYFNNGERTLPHIRQALVDATESTYLSFIDDDDLVPDYHVAEVMRALDSRPQYVGWQVCCYSHGKPTVTANHSIRYAGWYGDRGGLYRDISHLNPIRVDVARLADFRATPAGTPEDRAWADQLRGLVDSEVFIDRVMYHYLYDRKTSVSRSTRRLIRGFGPLPVANPHFAYHPESTGV